MQSGDPYPDHNRDRLKGMNSMWTYPAQLDPTMKPYSHVENKSFIYLGKDGDIQPVAQANVIGPHKVGDSVAIGANDMADVWPADNRDLIRNQNKMWTYPA